MTDHEQSLRRARTCYISSIAFFVGFCLIGTGGVWETFSPWVKGAFQLVGFLCGVFAWSLMCMAYDLRRKAL